MLWIKKFFYGAPVTPVKFISIDCERTLFSDHIHVPSHRIRDLDLIVKYGDSIKAAKAFMGRKWFLTERGYLVCGEVSGLIPLHVSIPIDSNLDFLSKCSPGKIREIEATPIHIAGFHKEADGKVSTVGGFRARFYQI